jgi:hypothetical protein
LIDQFNMDSGIICALFESVREPFGKHPMNDPAERIQVLCEDLLLRRKLSMKRFVEELMQLAQEHRCIWADLDDETTFIFSARNGARINFTPPKPSSAKARFRAICVNVAAWGIENGGRRANPYGDHIAFEAIGVIGNRFRMQLDYMNTLSCHWFRIEALNADLREASPQS